MRLLALMLLPLALSGRAADPRLRRLRDEAPGADAGAASGRLLASRLPVPLSDLRLLTVRHYGWDGKVETGQLVVNEDFARPLVGVFRRLYERKFPIRHMRFADQYGPGTEPHDTSGSFHCRPPAASPCPGSKPSSNWSMHAYGLAVGPNPRENPYVGCGVSYHADARPYIDRTRLRKGMVTPLS